MWKLRQSIRTQEPPRQCRGAAITLLLLLTGCGSELADVNGSITLDGQKVVAESDLRTTVLFSPREAGRPTGNGVVSEEGDYSVFVGATEGLLPGAYAVAVTVTKILPASVPGGTPSGKLLSAKRYASPRESGLEANVEPGANRFDFELESERGLE